MTYGDWPCRLYGHQWHHQGEYEVVLTDDSGPTYPFRCVACEARMYVDGNGDRHDGNTDREPGAPEPDLEAATDPEVAVPSEDG